MSFVSSPPREFMWRGRRRVWNDVPDEAPPREARKHYAVSLPLATYDSLAVIARHLRVNNRTALNVVLADIVEAGP